MTELAPYPEYKDSGVDWLGEVPEGWQLEPLGTNFVERKTTVSDADYPPLSVTRSGIVPQLDDVAKTENGDARKLVKAGDFAINSRSDRKGSAGVADRDGSVSVITTVVTPRQMDPRFVHHLLRSVPFQEEYYRFGSGIVADLWSTRWPAMKGIRLAVPSAAEQSTVARFLDRETAEIDAFITDQEELIALLTERRAATITHAVTRGLDPSAPMKGSGSTWFPSLPADWRMSPIGLVTSLIQTGPFGSQLHSDEYVEDGVPLINPMHIVDGTLRPSREMSVTEEKAMELSRHSLRLGDVIVARRGELGRCAVTTPSAVGYLCGTGSAIIRLNREVFSPEYFQLVFSSEQAKCALLQFSVGSTMENLNSDVVAALKIPCPPLHQQQTVVEHLRHETAELDAAIADAREAIALSKERRAALISAAVTGKIDVRTVA